MRSSVILLLTVFSIKLFSQNVGIGTNAPLSKLHVAGTIRSDTLIGPGVRSLFAAPNGRIYDSLVTPSTLNWQITGNSNITSANFLGTTNANDVIFKTNNIEWARLLSTGNFGINTPTPLEKLHVNGNILANDGVYAQSSFNVGYSSATVISDIFQPWTDNGIKIYDGNSLSHLHVEALGHCAIQAYGTGGSPKPALENTAYSPLALQDKGGNVGIGTIAPGNKLEITSTTANTSGLRFTNLTSASSTVATNGKALSVDVNGDVVLMPSLGNAWELLGNAGTTAGTNFLGTTDVQDLVFKTNNTEKARILSSGNFGIGTSTPGQLLHVNGNALANEFWIFSGAGDLKIHNAGTANTMVFNTSGLQRMRIDNNGLVGINTTAPSSRLEVDAIGGDGITIKATTGTDAGDLMFFDAAGIEKGRIYTNPLAASGLIFSGSSTPASHVFIDNIGNVGIGNTTPANRLHITSAAANTSGLRFTNLTSASPTVATTGKALSVDVNGDVVLIPSSGNAWELLGNAGTTAGTNFLGTTDAQDLVFKTNAIEQARIVTNGNFGIGTAAPVEKLHVGGNVQIGNALAATATGNYLTFSDVGNNTDVLSMFRTNTVTDQSDLNVSIGDNFTQAAGTDRFNIGAYGSGIFNNIFTVTSEGRVGIGEYNPASLFHVNRPTVSGAPVMTFQSGGMVFNAFINTTFGTYTNPAGIFMLELGGAESYMFGGEILPDANGGWNLGAATQRWNTVFATNGTINTSDETLKKDITGLSFGLADLLKLRPVEYNWKDNTFKGYCNGKNLGFLAQDLEKIIPNVVYTPKSDKDTYGVNYEALIPVLTKSIQDLNEKLEAKTADLKLLADSYQTQINELKKMIEELKK